MKFPCALFSSLLLLFVCVACTQPSRHATTGSEIATNGSTGAIGESLMGNSLEEDVRAREADDEMLKRQQKEIDRQRREIEDIKRQKHYDEKYREYLQKHDEPLPRDEDTFKTY